jgi:hypothetical protein
MGKRRFTVTLDGGIQPELKLRDLLDLYPSGRRQHKIRHLLRLGVKEIESNRTCYNRLQFSGYESLKYRVGIYLHDSVPEDQQILHKVNDIPEDFRALWLLTALVLGFKADTGGEPSNPAIGADDGHENSTKSSAAFEEVASAKVDPRAPANIALLSQESREPMREGDCIGIGVQDAPPKPQRPAASVEQGGQGNSADGSIESAPKLPGLLKLFQ